MLVRRRVVAAAEREREMIVKCVSTFCLHALLKCVYCILPADAIADDTVRYQYVKKKGYVRLHTNKGDVNLELHCDKVKTDTHTHV